jgi:selenide,water dikinase
MSKPQTIPSLTSLSHGAGCGCKLPAAEVHRIAAALSPSADPNLLVGTSTADDAGVYRISDELALVQTVDFFTPIVDDPFDFGAIAATNALSDVYAMGGTPLTALNLVAFPLERLGGDVLRRILEGGAAVAAEAGVAIVGGHSIDDAEPKYGLAVTGTVHPDRLLRNSTARPGDALYLSKPLGGGIVATAAKRGLASDELIARAVAVMTTLNREASLAAIAAEASAMTDVTGYGLLGHAYELATGSGVTIELSAATVPAIEGVEELLLGAEPPIAGGTRANRAWVGDHVAWDPDVPEHRRWLISDAMTSGGLLIAAPQAAGASLPAARIGTVVAATPGHPAISVSA